MDRQKQLLTQQRSQASLSPKLNSKDIHPSDSIDQKILYKLNNSIGSDLASVQYIDEDYIELEQEILSFCTKNAEKVILQLNKTLQEDKDRMLSISEQTTKQLKKLTNAKIAFG